MADPNTLIEISKKHQGKYSDKWSLYLDFYWELFEPTKDSSFDLVEIGIQNGGSLEIWGQLFRNVKKIVGFDNDPKCASLNFEDQRIKVFIGDASNKVTGRIVEHETSDLGLVIDDGSHTSSDIIRSFLILFPLLKPGGIYVIEDLHASYWESWQGGLSDPDSSMQFLKLLADVVNFDYWGIDAKREDIFNSMSVTSDLIKDSILAEVKSVTFTDSLCVVRKKDESDSGLGVRVGSGTQADVEPMAAESNGTFLITPSQDLNPLANPRNLSLRRIIELKNENQELKNENQELKNENQELKNENQELKNENQELKNENQALKNELLALQQTISWRITLPLRKVRKITTLLQRKSRIGD